MSELDPFPFFDPPPPRTAPFVLLVGRTRAARRKALSEFQYLDEHQRPVFLYLTARRRKVEALRAAFDERPGKPPAFLPDVYTWGDWRDRLSERWGDGRAPLPKGARELLMGAVWRAVRGRARYWTRLPDRPAVRRALADLVEDWEGGNPGPYIPPLPDDPSALRLPGDDVGAEAAPPGLRHDLALVVDAWRGALKRTPGWTDRPTAARSLLRALKAPPPALLRSLRRFRSLIVDDLIDLPPLERELLAAFVDAFRRAVPDAPVHLCLEGRGPEWGAERFFLAADEPDPGVRATLPLRASWSRWLAQGGALREEAAAAKVADDEPDRVDLADLAAEDGRVVGDPAAVAGGVRVRRYNDELAEVHALARALKARLLTGAPLDDHHVAFPALDRYAPIVRDVLPAFGIPVRIERGEALRAAPPVAASRRLLDLAVEGADRAALRSLAASGFVKHEFVPTPETVAAHLPDDPELRAALDRGVEPATVEALHRAAVEAGGDGPSPVAWIDPILRRARVKPPRDDAGWDRLIGLVAAALQLDALVERLGRLRRAPDVPSAARAFRDLLGEVGLGPSDDEPSEVDSPLARAEADAARALAAFHRLIEGMEPDLEAVRVAQGVVDAAPLELFREALEQALDDAFVRPAKATRGVRIVGLPDLHGVDVPWLWVGGLVDSAFPRAPKPSFLLPPAARRLVPRADRADEDRAVFASLLRNAGHGERLRSATLIVSAPRTTDGADAGPSSVVADLLALRTDDGDLGAWFEARQAEEEAALPELLGVRELLGRPEQTLRLPAALSPLDAAEIARHRRIVAARADPDGFGRFDGVVGLGTPHRRAAVGWVRRLIGVRDGRLPASASGLERWAACSIRWFFENVLSADEPDEHEVEPSPADQGSVLHIVLERLLAERIEAAAQGRLPSPALAGIDAPALAAVKRRALELLRAAAPTVFDDLEGPWAGRVMRDLAAGLDPDDPGVAPWAGPLATFLEEEATSFLDLVPQRLEWRFRDLDPALAAARIDGVRAPSPVRTALRGSVDRVDVGDGLGGARLAVFDYKSGKLADPAGKVDRGLLLQPVVYATAAASADHAPPAQTITGYLEVREGQATGRRFFLGDGAVIDALAASGRGGKALGSTSRAVEPALWAAWLRRADLYGRWIADGVFPPTLAGPVHARCDRCPHRRACRVDHLRNADLARTAEQGLGLLPAPVAASEHLEPS